MRKRDNKRKNQKTRFNKLVSREGDWKSEI